MGGVSASTTQSPTALTIPPLGSIWATVALRLVAFVTLVMLRIATTVKGTATTPGIGTVILVGTMTVTVMIGTSVMTVIVTVIEILMVVIAATGRNAEAHLRHAAAAVDTVPREDAEATVAVLQEVAAVAQSGRQETTIVRHLRLA